MLRLNEGWDYTLYKIYIVGGFALLLGIPIIGSLIFRENLPYAEYGIYYLACLTGWVIGILAYWWWVFLFKDYPGTKLLGFSKSDQVPPLSTLRNTSTLHQAMSIYGGDLEQLRKAHWKMKFSKSRIQVKHGFEWS